MFSTINAWVSFGILFMVISLIILAAATILLWILPFTWPAAAAMTALFVAVAVPLAIIAISLGDVLHITSSKNIPGKPGCFDEDTKIHLKNKFVKVKNLKTGDYLFDGSKVTAFFKISTHDKHMYKINNLVVSGSHKIRYNNTWISVKNHPEAIYLEEYSKPYIYCYNTTSKRIRIDEHLLLDWDDVDDLDFIELKHLVSNFIQFNAPTSHIHSYLEGGFDKVTLIELEDGRCVSISDIKVNDQLRFGERVLGIVKIDTKNLSQVKKYKIKDKIIVGGPNLWIDDNDLGKFTTLGLDGESIEKPKRLYQLLTDTGSFTICGIKFMDYNSAIEQIMGDEWSMDQGLFSV